jgi:hypothetical protein
MASAHPLRDVFSELAATGRAVTDADAVLDAHGHADLPDGLVAEAVVSYADTAPVEVAEHLAPFVMAHSAVYPAAGHAESWLDVLATAPEPLVADEALDSPTPVEAPALDPDPADLDFGTGELAATPSWADANATGAEARADMDVPVHLDPLDEYAPPATEVVSDAPDLGASDDEVDEGIDEG